MLLRNFKLQYRMPTNYSSKHGFHECLKARCRTTEWNTMIPQRAQDPRNCVSAFI